MNIKIKKIKKKRNYIYNQIKKILFIIANLGNFFFVLSQWEVSFREKMRFLTLQKKVFRERMRRCYINFKLKHKKTIWTRIHGWF